ncbi:50S ribosomal protein L21 [Phormidium tenue]|uniref:Large ribosomal subunit protein bL21 n=1 Tax=Phormidium tenue NIES-30 TaxID=549789 RepID=A0A1U7J3Z7_9CYAN|nr:50S ribosomal protein L21 [Phormidium tenue]MBD2233073.1 50S ribosomal protein L21 [Phormidium tenue FACHB-1052]OKH47116.1 50S ribosomal protein L21 [Phormidium tenue NIES-30]
MTYAIVETSGTQLRVEPGRFYDVDRLALDVDDQVTLDRVLFVSNDGESVVGQPVVEGATVVGSVVSHLRGRKVIVYKMQPKKKTRKKQGHRQELTRVMINSIEMNGKVIAGESAPAQADAPAKAAVEAEAES